MTVRSDVALVDIWPNSAADDMRLFACPSSLSRLSCWPLPYAAPRHERSATEEFHEVTAATAYCQRF